MKKEKFMRSFKDYTPQSSPQDESRILKEAATAPRSRMESSAGGAYKKNSRRVQRQKQFRYAEKHFGRSGKKQARGHALQCGDRHFYEQFSPLLNNVQRRQLKSVVERLKRI